MDLAAVDLAAVDVQYDEVAQTARAALVAFADWTDASAGHILVCDLVGVAPYVSGEFYRRELPALLDLWAALPASLSPKVVIVDSYVDLEEGRPGLGRRLFEALGQTVQVVGVAKTKFPDAPAEAVLRGESKTPLWVSSTGDHKEAADAIRRMHGPYRIPTLLKLVDQCARGRQPTP